MYEYAARLERIIDADTFDLHVDLGFGIGVTHRIRLAWLNAPEKNTPQGRAARQYVQDWFDEHGPHLLLRTFKDKREKYGRYLGVIEAGGRSLNADLRANGLAVEYDGGTRTAVPAQGQQGDAQPPTPVR